MPAQPLSAKQRLKLLELVFKDNVPVAKACRSFGVSRFTFYKWAKRYSPDLPRSQNLENLRDKKRRVFRFARQTPGLIEEKVKKLALSNPSWSKYKIWEDLKKQLGREAIGLHGVYNILRRSGLQTPERRKEYKKLALQLGKRVLTPEQRLEVIERAVIAGVPVAQVCRDFGISRFTFYKWKKRWERGDRKPDTLVDRKRRIDSFARQATPSQEQLVLSLVVEFPDLSKYKLAERLGERFGPVLGVHGVYNILRRHSLTLSSARFAYSQTQVPVVPVPLGWQDRIRLVWDQFITGLAPAPPPLEALAKWGPPFLISLAASSILSLSFLWWINLLVSYPFPIRAGLIFASTALFAGSIFFLYSMKYYFTLAIVLSFSQQAGANGNPPAGGVNGKNGNGKKGFLEWVLGLANGNGLGRQKPTGYLGGPVGLEPSLEHVVLKRRPFVSVHIPLYNEVKVVERILSAVTSFDYENFEVIIADDSTDETTTIVRRFIEQWKSQNTNPKIQIKHIHRTSREGFKGGALAEALKHTDPRAEFVVVFDADFVPYPDTLELFLKYFQVTAGTLDFQSRNPKSEILNSKQIQNSNNPNSKQFRASDFDIRASRSNIAAVQGYQWHVLNKSENWITRGVRAEYSGSYVIERSGTEILGALKMIAGSVYMVRRDLLDKFGWGTSITEDFQLTLRLYEVGYKVVYTPYIQAPAECVSTIRRLVGQRMRWAEGHSHNIRRMFVRLLSSPRLTLSEKLEFLYLSPYYLQAFFFLIGTISWLLAETIFPARLPFWTSLWGWSLVLTNLLSLPLMNAVGLFLEEGEEKDYQGIISFVILSYILVPFQAYASIKGFLETREGPWFRTPKTGKITDIFTRGRFYRLISGILPGRAQPVVTGERLASSSQRLGFSFLNASRYTLTPNPYLSLATANSRFDSFVVKPKKNRYIAKVGLFIVVGLSTAFSYFGNRVPQGAITNLPIQARVEVQREDYSVVSQAVNLLKPREVLASSITDSIFAGETGNELVGAALVLAALLSFAFLIYLLRIKRRLLKKIIRPLFVFALVASWLLTSWPGIFNFPPKIQEAQAAITYQSAGAIAYSASGGTSVSPAYPASIAAGDLLVVIIGMKPSTANSGSVTTPSGWTAITGGSLTGAGGYGATLGIDTGNTNVFTFYRVADGTESGSQSFTLATNNVSWAQIYRLSTNATIVWSVAGATGSDTTGDASVSIAMTSDPGVAGGDFILGAMVIPTDVTTPSQFSAEALSQTGITFGTVTEISEPDSATGNDIGGVTYRAPVSSGTSSAAPTFTATAGGTTTDVRGPGVFIRIREIPIPEAPTLYPDDGGANQIAFNNTKQNDTTPIFRASAVHSTTFNRFQVELNTASNFGGTAYTETFSGTYSSGTQYNLQTTGTLNLPSTDGVTYYVRARASADGGTNYGSWSSGTWTYTYTSSLGDAEWFQTTDEQFDTGTLSNTGTFNDSVRLPGPETKTIYSTSVDQDFIVPADVDSITVKAWGAGGGGGGAQAGNGAAGGGGGYATSVISVTPEETLRIVIGGGGAGGTGSGGGGTGGSGGGGGATTAGGGAGAGATVTMGGGGGGGGYATVKRVSAFLVQAAGGGGGGGGGNASGEVGSAGGAGGGTNGLAGASGGGCGGPGGGGTQSAGGAAGTGSGCTGSAGSAGSANTGGAGGNNGGGGGGGGKFGGGGGQGDDDGGAGAGGGSGLGGTLTAGSGTSAGNNGDGDYAGSAGLGGAAGAATNGAGGNGNPGRIVLIYTTGNPAPSSSGTIMSTEIDYDWFDNATTWKQVYWSENETNGTVKVQVYYTVSTACDTIIPDGALSGNSTGFTSGPINIAGLSTSTYNRICLKATLTESGGTPYLQDWGVSVPEYSLLFLGFAPFLPGLLRRRRRNNLLALKS